MLYAGPWWETQNKNETLCLLLISLEMFICSSAHKPELVDLRHELHPGVGEGNNEGLGSLTFGIELLQTFEKFWKQRAICFQVFLL